MSLAVFATVVVIRRNNDHLYVDCGKEEIRADARLRFTFALCSVGIRFLIERPTDRSTGRKEDCPLSVSAHGDIVEEECAI